VLDAGAREEPRLDREPVVPRGGALQGIENGEGDADEREDGENGENEDEDEPPAPAAPLG
jgi:hypothetical protein